MTTSNRPRRSVLYMPGARARALEKARDLPADALILDLEDAVTPAEKGTARELVGQAVKDGGYGEREIIIRVNGADTEWGADDLAAAAAAGGCGATIGACDVSGWVPIEIDLELPQQQQQPTADSRQAAARDASTH